MIDGDVFHIGCYTSATGGKGDGVTLARRDRRTGTLTGLGVTAMDSPSFVTYHPRLPVLYAAHELDQGRASAWAVAPDGRLRQLDSQPTGGSSPCHLAVSPDGRYLATANYGSGSVAVHPLGDTGALGERSDLIEHGGAGRPGQDPRRQSSAHAHMVSWTGDARLSVVDLGVDAVLEYTVDGGGWASLAGEPLRTPPGTGPRHLAVGASGWLYLAGELDGSVAAYRPDPDTGRPRERARVSATVHSGPVQPSEIAVGPDGRFLYVANRGPDSIAVFALDSGLPRHVAEVPCGGAWPRHFLLRDGFLYVANERSHSIVTFRIPPATGVPVVTGAVFSSPSPTCIAVPPAWSE